MIRQSLLGFVGLLWAASFSASESPDWIRWTEVSSEVGLSEERVGDFGQFWADLNGDGWLDLVFMNHGYPPSLYVNQHGERFENRLKGSGLQVSDWLYPQQADRHGGSCADFDNDGDVDLFIAHGAKKGETLGLKRDELLVNQGPSKFHDRADSLGTLNPDGRARLGTWVDYDRDGRLDLYLGNFDSPNVLYRNRGAGIFEDQTESSGLGLVSAARPAWIDLDLDGDSDLVVIWPLKVFRNDASGRFREITRAIGLKQDRFRSTNAMGLGDFNGDGWTDLFVVSRRHSHALYLRQGARFKEVDREWGPEENETGTGLALGDLDLDGDLDLILGSSRRLRFFDNQSGKLVERTELELNIEMGEGSDFSLGDYDRDGDLDLAVSGAKQHFLFRNERTGGSWLQLTFQGQQSNRMGLGVQVWASRSRGDSTQLIAFRDYQGDNAVFRSAGCGPLHLGLGEGIDSVDLKVRWPSGQEEWRRAARVNQFLHVVEPASPVSQVSNPKGHP